MSVTADADVLLVVSFMQSNVPPAKLVAVACAVAKAAPLFWGHFESQEVAPLRLVHPPILADGRHTQ